MEWNKFLKYAKAHPETIPKDVKVRSNIYRECKAGKHTALCEAIRLNKPMTPVYDPNNDVHMLRARVKACEDYVTMLQASLNTSARKRKSRHTAP